MKAYIGVKLINAKPMNRLDYNIFRNWKLPEDENGNDEGFLVEYMDGGKPNTKEYGGYVSWSPEDVFNKAYSECENMTFGYAIAALKKGHKVTRLGWNGKDMFIYHVEAKTSDFLPYISMKTVDGKYVPWLASQTDILSEDWIIKV